MPIIKSAKKRVRVSAKANDRNRDTKNRLREAMKKLTAALSSKKGVAAAHAEMQAAVDTAVKKGIMHKNKAARRKSQIAASVKASGASVKGAAKPKATKPAAKAAKPAAKKAAPVKKATAKKVAKPAAKKPAAKKTTKK
jgi:small subunit ribosomal protein S20